MQGAPEVIERLASQRTEVWSSGETTVKFDPATGRVVEYIDGQRRLRVTLAPARERPARSSTPLPIGASRDEVVSRYGTPWAYTRDASRAHAFLAYGRSIVRLTLDDQRVAVAPATLRGRLRWRDADADGDGVLAPGEQATVTLTVDNQGPGEARAVRGTLRVESPATGTSVVEATPPLTLTAGTSGALPFRLVADSAQSSSEIVAVASATEANGFDLAPALRLRIPARPAGAPRIVVRDTRIDDASRDGRLAPRELADLTIRPANTGTAPTPTR